MIDVYPKDILKTDYSPKRTFDLCLFSENKIIIIGDMLELGDYSNTEHKNILDLAAHYHFDKMISIGWKSLEE